jgi:hypothetical protein
MYSFWALNMAWLEWTIVSVLVSLMEMLTWVLEGHEVSISDCEKNKLRVCLLFVLSRDRNGFHLLNR